VIEGGEALALAHCAANELGVPDQASTSVMVCSAFIWIHLDLLGFPSSDCSDKGISQWQDFFFLPSEIIHHWIALSTHALFYTIKPFLQQ
jgi:hypothetical protein